MRWLASLVVGLVATGSWAVGGEFGGKSTEQWLDLLKTSKEVKDRSASLIALEVIGARKGVVDGVVHAVLHDTDAGVRREAALVLGRMAPDSKGAIPILGEVLEKDKEGAVRQAAAMALGGRLVTLAKTQVLVLGKALKDEHRPTRVAAAETLKNMKEDAREAYPDLLALVQDARNEEVARRHGMYALSRLVVAVKSLHEKAPDEVIAALTQAIKEARATLGVREAALDGLGFIKNEKAVPGLIEGLKSDDVELRRTAGRGLAQLGEKAKEASAAVLAAMKDKDEIVRSHAIIVSGHLGREEPAAVKALIEAAKKKDETLDNKVTAIQALGDIGKAAAEAVADLEAMALNDVRARVREAARDAARKIKESKV